MLGQDDRKPLAQITVNAYKQSFQTAANSDSNGMARLRLPPGDYQITASRAIHVREPDFRQRGSRPNQPRGD